MSQLTKGADAVLNHPSGEISEFHAAYDHCLWTIVTSSGNELAEFADYLWEEPYTDLPVPLIVAIYRLAGLESKDNPDQMQTTVNSIAAYCTPTEEENATQGIRRLMGLLRPDGGSTPQK